MGVRGFESSYVQHSPVLRRRGNDDDTLLTWCGVPTVPPAPPGVSSPTHDSLLVKWLENELGAYDAPIDRYVVCWKRVTEAGDDLSSDGTPPTACGSSVDGICCVVTDCADADDGTHFVL